MNEKLFRALHFSSDFDQTFTFKSGKGIRCSGFPFGCIVNALKMCLLHRELGGTAG
jgi:hypothetical protein